MTRNLLKANAAWSLLAHLVGRGSVAAASMLVAANTDDAIFADLCQSKAAGLCAAGRSQVGSEEEGDQVSSVPPTSGKPSADEPRPTPEEENASYGWFLLAMAAVLIPFALVLIWVISDAPKFLFQK